jgi:hypothetical protein
LPAALDGASARSLATAFWRGHANTKIRPCARHNHGFTPLIEEQIDLSDPVAGPQAAALNLSQQRIRSLQKESENE